ncbi:MAG: hypothetical protein K2N39_11550, partial [Lachnospiraceae bacterium]|nr:hypothetical protein [Lachnospiraceae bacterium]
KIELDLTDLEEVLRILFLAIAEKEEKIERNRKEHEEDLRNYRNSLAERDARIRQLQAELETLRKRG